MKIFVSILQVLLSLWSVTGAVYMMSNYNDLGSEWALSVLPQTFWTILGCIQIFLAGVLILSIWKRLGLYKFSRLASLALAVITLVGAFLYSAYSGFPGVLWALIPAALFALVAYKNKI